MQKKLPLKNFRRLNHCFQILKPSLNRLIDLRVITCWKAMYSSTGLSPSSSSIGVKYVSKVVSSRSKSENSDSSESSSSSCRKINRF